ncbi:MAG: PQQ-dependent sugar dehydrogenase [Cellvibrio sp.]|nr:PQQ-dependent sugar dehydrogenase [Cellvibrio sp.]
MKRIGVFFLITILSGFCKLVAEPYHSLTSQCDGFPQLPLITLNNICVGLVVQKSQNIPLKKPRSLIEIDKGQLLVIDAGSWMPNQGSLLLIDYSGKTPIVRSLLNTLNLPHKILYGHNNYIYFSEADKISRFYWKNNAIQNLEIVIDHLPFSPTYLHPLKNFTFDLNGDLLVNIGSSSDKCENKQASCGNGEEASIRRYSFHKDTNQYSQDYSILAYGLRNSMALAVHSSGTIVQAENSIDLPDAEEPYEEFNIIQEGKFYGWPKCYNANIDLDGKTCTANHYQAPWTLLPPHVAPLDMLYYQGNKIPALKNKLIMSWHGFRIAGNRLVAYELDSKGRPVLQEKAIFRRAPVDANSEYTEHLFAPRGGLQLDSPASQQVAQHQEIISEWHPIENLRPEGSPVGLTQSKDGSLWILDDRNAAILRLSTGTSYTKTKIHNNSSTIIEIPTGILSILKNNCSQCHTEIATNPQTLFNQENWLAKDNGRYLIESKVFFEKSRPMPPSGQLSNHELHELQSWLHTLDI